MENLPKSKVIRVTSAKAIAWIHSTYEDWKEEASDFVEPTLPQYYNYLIRKGIEAEKEKKKQLAAA